MGKKRRIIAKGKKFGTKYASHPASGGVTTTTPSTTTSNSERISAIAQKVETIEQAGVVIPTLFSTETESAFLALSKILSSLALITTLFELIAI